MRVEPRHCAAPPPIPSNQGWGWLLFTLFHIIDLLMRKIGGLIQKGLSYRYTVELDHRTA